MKIVNVSLNVQSTTHTYTCIIIAKNAYNMTEKCSYVSHAHIYIQIHETTFLDP